MDYLTNNIVCCLVKAIRDVCASLLFNDILVFSHPGHDSLRSLESLESSAASAVLRSLPRCLNAHSDHVSAHLNKSHNRVRQGLVGFS